MKLIHTRLLFKEKKGLGSIRGFAMLELMVSLSLMAIIGLGAVALGARVQRLNAAHDEA